MPASPVEADLLERIRRGEAAAWRDFIQRYEGRLLAYARARLSDVAVAEDIVQEAFIGFLNALPNYDPETPLDSFLFTITAHKLTDHFRRIGRRPALQSLAGGDESSAGVEVAGPGRKASSLARSKEHQQAEEQFLARTLREFITQWVQSGEYERLKCVELLFVRGMANKQVAEVLGISEQAVANHKYFVVNKLKAAADVAQRKDFDPERLGID